MNRPPPPASGRNSRQPTFSLGRLTLSLLLLVAAGCTTTTSTSPSSIPARITGNVAEYRSGDIRIRLLGTLDFGDDDSPIEDEGWLEYVLLVENPGKEPLMVHNVKLLGPHGRYFDSAASYDQVTSPPDSASEITANVATRAVSTATGQVIPYGGTIVGIISQAISASNAESKMKAQREFDRRKLKAVELAPAGKITGSAFLPRVTNAKSLLLVYGNDRHRKRIEIQLPRAPSAR